MYYKFEYSFFISQHDDGTRQESPMCHRTQERETGRGGRERLRKKKREREREDEKEVDRDRG